MSDKKLQEERDATPDPLLDLSSAVADAEEAGVKLGLDFRRNGVEVRVNGGQEPSGYPDATFERLADLVGWARSLAANRAASLRRQADDLAARAQSIESRLSAPGSGRC